MFKEKPRLKAKRIKYIFPNKASIRKERASSKDIKSKNLYPPIFLNTKGASIKAKIELIEPKI